MINKVKISPFKLDLLGLFLAGLINTFLALLVAGVFIAPGTRSGEPDLLLRATWIVENKALWQGSWLFWFAVTLSFSWSYYALGRHLKTRIPWASLTIGLAIIAAAIDIVGIIVYLLVLPGLAEALISTTPEQVPVLETIFSLMESVAVGLTNITAFGLYTLAGLLLLPAVFVTSDYPRWLAWLGVAEWGIAGLATILLVFVPNTATAPLLVSFVLYAPWVWGNGWWLLTRQHPG